MVEKQRVASIDVVRGFALLGILVMNIQSFALPHAAYLNPTAYGSLADVDGLAWSVGRLLFDFKFISLFSTLFGASLMLAGDAASQRRRLGWLIVFGLLHGVLIWYGDVLFTYGVVGLLVLQARGWTVRRKLTLGAALLSMSLFIALGLGIGFDDLPTFILNDLHSHYDRADVVAEVLAFRSGWLTQLPVRAGIAFDNQLTGTLFESGWRAAGCMVLGMAAVERGVFEKGVRTRWTLLCLALGLAVSGVALALQWNSGFELRTWLFAQALHELGSIGVAAGILFALVRVANTFPSASFTQAVGRLGRVAFTAYLMQSLVGTLVFGGHGLGLFGSVSRSTLFVLPFAFWSFQLALAWWWTARFRVGPLEALWRGLWKGNFSLSR
jgi:uncharacterized protein